MDSTRALARERPMSDFKSPVCAAGVLVSANNRQVDNQVLWIVRTGSAWRDLPEVFGE